jgi:hypothetical protein
MVRSTLRSAATSSRRLPLPICSRERVNRHQFEAEARKFAALQEGETWLAS